MLLFIFDLSRRSTLNAVKDWYRQARGLNRVRTRLLPPSAGGSGSHWCAWLPFPPHTHARQTAHAFLVGTKYDIFTMLPPEEQEDIDKQVWEGRLLLLACVTVACVCLHPCVCVEVV